MPKSR